MAVERHATGPPILLRLLGINIKVIIRFAIKNYLFPGSLISKWSLYNAEIAVIPLWFRVVLLLGIFALIWATMDLDLITFAFICILLYITVIKMTNSWFQSEAIEFAGIPPSSVCTNTRKNIKRWILLPPTPSPSPSKKHPKNGVFFQGVGANIPSL